MPFLDKFGSEKPKVLVCVLCSTERGGWVNPSLCLSLLQLQKDPRLDITVETVQDKVPHAHARNVAIVKARQMHADACVQIDNDNVPPADFADIIHEAISTGKHVVTLPYGILLGEHEGGAQMAPHDNGPKDGRFRITGCGPAGMMIVSSEVWRVIPRGPWFVWHFNDDEVLSRKLGEDYAFCELVQSKGLKVWTHQRVAGHLKTVDATRWVLAANRMSEALTEARGGERPFCAPTFIE